MHFLEIPEYFQNRGLYREIKNSFIHAPANNNKNPNRYKINSPELKLEVKKEKRDDVSLGFEEFTLNITDNKLLKRAPANLEDNGWLARKTYKLYNNGYKLNLIEQINLWKRIKKADTKVTSMDFCDNHRDGKYLEIELNGVIFCAYKINIKDIDSFRKTEYSLKIEDRNGKFVYENDFILAKQLYKLLEQKHNANQGK